MEGLSKFNAKRTSSPVSQSITIPPITLDVSSTQKINVNQIGQSDFEGLSNSTAKILTINCDNFEVLDNFKIENFPNVFVLGLKIPDCDLKDIRDFSDRNREILIQFNDHENLIFFRNGQEIQPTNEEEINEKMNEEISNKFNEEIEFELEDFLFFLIKFNHSFFDVDEIQQKLITLPFPTEFYLLDKAFASDDEIFQKIILLFYNSVTKNILHHILKAQKLENLLKFLNVSSLNKEIIEVMLKVDDQLLVNLIKFDSFEILKKIITHSKIIGLIKIEVYENLIQTSVEKEFFHIFEMLKNLPCNFDKEEITKKFLNILNDVNFFHELIKNGNFENLKNFTEFFIENHPTLHICYGESQFSALELSIECENIQIYSFLRAKGFHTDKGGKLSKKINNLSREKLEEIRTENLKYTLKDPVNILLTKCDLDACSELFNFNDVRKMIKKLYESEEISEIFNHTAKSDVQIVFDYKTESVFAMDPACGEDTMGSTYYLKNLLFVGKDEDDRSRYGTFTHEIAHYVMYMLYGNGCLPYCRGDEKREKEWNNVVEETRKIINNQNDPEKIIKWVFSCYEGEIQKAELIVRPAHIWAYYHDSPLKIQELEKTYEKLFYYFRNRVLKDLKMKNVYRVIKINKDFGVLDKIVNSKFQVEKSEVKLLSNNNDNSNNNNNNNSNSNNNPEPQTSASSDKKVILISSEVPQITLNKIHNELSQIVQNKLEIRCRNIFVNPEMLENLAIKNELEDLFKSGCVDRVFVDAKHSTKLNLPKVKNTYIIHNSSNLKILKLLKVKSFLDEIKFENLTKKSKLDILYIPFKFNNEKLNLLALKMGNKIISNEILDLLSSSEQVIIKPRNHQKDPNLIELERHLELKQCFTIFVNSIEQKKYFEYFDKKISEFLTEIENEHVVVLADIAGSGKTTVLSEFYHFFLAKFPSFWLSFVSLKKHKFELLDEKILTKDFPNFVADEILKLNELEKLIFITKYEQNKVIILFDAFDEISPDCKENSIKLFKSHQTFNKSQIFVTTRTHLEQDLEGHLRVFAHRLKPLDEENQIKFLRKFWTNFHFENQTEIQENLIERNATLLVRKVSSIFATSSQFIGILLQLRILGDFFKDKLTNNFEDLVENIKILKIYKMHFESSVNSEEKLGKTRIYNILNLQLPFYESLALKHFLGNSHNLFGMKISDLQIDDALEELARGGVIQFDGNRNIFFMHETYPEYLLASVIIKCIIDNRRVGENFNNFVEFFVKVLSDKRFQVTRAFLNDLIEENPLNLEKVEKLSQKLFEIVENLNFLQFCGEEAIFDLLDFILEMAKTRGDDFLKRVIEAGCDQWKKNLLMHFIHNSRKVEKFGKFLEKIFQLYPLKSDLENFLKLVDCEGNTIFNISTSNSVDKEIFLLFWNKIAEKFDRDDLIQFVNIKNNFKRTFLSYAVEYCKTNLEKLKVILEVIKNLMTHEELIEYLQIRDDNGWNVLYRAVQKKRQIFEIVFDFISNLYGNEREKIRQILSDHNFASGWKNILQVVSKWCSVEGIQMVWEKIQEFFNRDEQIEFLFSRRNFNGIDYDGNLEAAASNMHLDVFPFVWNLMMENCADEEDFRRKVFNENSTNFFTLTFEHASPDNFKPVAEKVCNFLGRDKFKEILAKKIGCRCSLLVIATKNQRLDSVVAAWQLIENYFSKDEILNNFEINSVKFTARRFSKSDEIFEFVTKKVAEY